MDKFRKVCFETDHEFVKFEFRFIIIAKFNIYNFKKNSINSSKLKFLIIIEEERFSGRHSLPVDGKLLAIQRDDARCVARWSGRECCESTIHAL